MDTILLNKVPAAADKASVSGAMSVQAVYRFLSDFRGDDGLLASQPCVGIISHFHNGLPVMQRLAMKRLTDVGIGVLTPLAEQLANPLPHAMALATLDEIASGAHKELPAGTKPSRCPGTCTTNPRHTLYL